MVNPLIPYFSAPYSTVLSYTQSLFEFLQVIWQYIPMNKKISIIVTLFASLTLALAACGKDSEQNAKTTIDPKGDSARESVNKYVGTALRTKEIATKQVEESHERQRMMESLGDE